MTGFFTLNTVAPRQGLCACGEPRRAKGHDCLGCHALSSRVSRARRAAERQAEKQRAWNSKFAELAKDVGTSSHGAENAE